jgi:glutamate synthase (NADPH/NADH) large chain
MSGGIAYVYDPENTFKAGVKNPDLNLLAVETEEDHNELFTLVENHYNLTMSPLAEKLLTNWEKEVGKFVKVFPEEYRQALIRIAEENQTINN